MTGHGAAAEMAELISSGTGRGAVGRQVRLPLRQALAIALRSLKLRLARSVLTFLTITMAMAFLVDVWITNALDPTVRNAILIQRHIPVVVAVRRTREIWLVVLSLLVCMVGISNAMLINVMERFREIGTMKCLGALNSFILKLFLLESLGLGVLGTLAGLLFGLAVAMAVALNHFGAVFWTLAPWGALAGILPACLAIGPAITVLAALYPAWKAAHMEPVAAMRVEV